MYQMLSKKVDNFKRYLKEEEEVRHKVKNINYYWYILVLCTSWQLSKY